MGLADQGDVYAAVRDELTVTAERDRVARDVHDVLGHSLTVVSVKAELAERLVDLDPARARAELAEIQTLTRQALAALDPRRRSVAAWVLREAVTNVVRHSGAQHCAVTLEDSRLLITDDGRGVDELMIGNGLRGIRERVDGSGGTLRVGPAAGGGTELDVSW